ncbi:MAG: cadherin-like domain-containing protein [Litoreibacter sp.]|uniref:cadherin-like domain-containing protein n=1 Tax=Litoreibacter sp. TaxID=1969459 RepID=UPI003298B501
MPDVLITFENLQAGDIVNGQFAANGVTISSGDPSTPPMVFDTDNPTGGDSDLATNNLGNVLILSEDGDSNDPDDNAGGGEFIFEFDEPSDVVNFNVLDVEESGVVRLFDADGNLIDTITISPTGNNGQATVNINAQNVSRMEVELNGSGAIDNICFITPEDDDMLDGVVEGSAGDDVIDVNYDGDPDGDFIDANDEILPGEGPNDDIVDAFGGNDTINSGEGNDEVYAGSGDDTVNGGAGDDIIYGDSNYDGAGAGNTVRESLNWDDAPNFGNGNDANGFTQDTGNVEVTFSILSESGYAETEFETDTQLVSGIDSGSETVEDNSSLFSVTNGDSGRAEYELSYSDAVENVEFRINDIDGDGVVRVRAFDEDGNAIVVELDAGNSLTLSNTDGVVGNDTATSNGGYAADTSPNYSVVVSIAGPVSRIEILHDQVGSDNSGINITDVFFDVNADVVDDGPDGNDLLRGGDGNDIIFGEGGHDRLEGGNGDDTLDGGDGNDVIIGGAGNDTAQGGAGNDEIWMGSGNDTVDGGDGNDWIHGQSGNDTLNGGSGDDMIFGEDGDDRIEGGDGNDALSGGNGDDDIFGQAGDDTIQGGAGDDFLIGGDGDDTITGGDDDDVLCGNDGDDTLMGGNGNDVLEGMNDNDTLFGGAGNDTLYGDAGNDELTGGEGADTIFGGSGRDTILGGNDGDTVDGGTTGDDFDVLDLTGEGPFRIVNQTVDADGDSTSGTVEFLDDNGDVTGSLVFTEIEQIIGDLVNQGPDAVDDTATGTEDESVTIDVLANDTDPENDDLTVIDATSPNGEVEINADGTITFTPAENFNGDTTITYTIEDEAGNTDTATVELTVEAVNDAPDAVNDSDVTDEDTPITVDLLANDTDVDGDTLTVTNATVPANQGTLVDNGDGTVTFTPAENFNGTATINYDITDGNGGRDWATHTIEVGAINDGPDAVNDADVTDEDTPITVDLLANDTDLDGDTLTVTGATVPENQGTLVDNGDGTVTFIPAENFNGEVTISYAITDGNGGTDTAIHTVTVLPVNDAPVAVDDIAETFEDEAVVIDLIGNDTDVDGDPLNIGTVSVPAEQGTVVDNGDGTVTFTPAPNYTGPAEITYTVQDGQGGEDSGEAVVNVEVIGVNDGPQAVDDAVTTDEDTPVTIDVLDNDFDTEGDDLSITTATVPADQGMVEVVDGELVFTPAENFNGEATITYGITDGNGGADIGEVIVTVTPVNDDPVAVDDLETTDEDQPITIDLISNDTDVDGDDLSVGSVTVPAEQGTVVDNGDGTVTFTPAPNFNGPATITYTVVDGNGGEDEGQAVVSVGAVNDGPVAEDDSDVTTEDTAVTVDLLANDSDADGDDLTVINATVPADEGTLVDNGDGTVTFTPAENFNGTATISYEISDSNGGTDNAVHTIEVTEVNDGPDAVDDEASTNNLTPVEIVVLGNDTDPEDDDLTVTEASVDEGEVTINADGTLTYTPEPDFGGVATITYTITDGNGGFDTATVTVSVNDGIVEGTAGDDLIDENYLDDPEGDLIDNNDEFLPGEGPQDDIVLAGDGDDTVFAGEGNDEVFGEEGDDTLHGEAGDDFLSGGAGNDEILGGDGDDTIEGDDGDDLLWGGAGDDTIIGGDGNDNVMGGSGDDTVDLGEGDDIAQTGSGDDTVLGGAGNDTIETNDGNDTVEGGDGDDVIDTSGDSPRPDLGYPGLFPGDLDPNDDIDFVDGGDGDDTISTGDDADTIIGGAGNDTIDGGLDADTIDGGDGDDRIVGGEGSDVINAGAGDDIVFAGIDPDLGLPDNLDIADVDGDLVLNNGMDVVNGGDGNDTIFGADDDDTLNGDAGDDFIDGGVDADDINGGTGNDTLIGGQGADTIDGGDDADTIIVSSAEDGAGDIIDGGTGGDDNDVLDLTGAGPLRVVGETVDADGDSTSGTVEFLDGVGGDVIGTLQFSEIESIVPCFTPGTSIATVRGEILVEDLMVGDKIITRDNGIQEIRWIGAKRMDGRELQNNPHLQPVLIQKGSLGNGLPERDMLVSPNHRMLVNNDRVALYFEENEVLVSAKHLVNPSQGVQTIASMGTTYIHFMFDNHEVVLSNGAWTESFQPGDYSLKGIGNSQRNEIFDLFPELQGEAGREAYASARLTLKKHEAKLLFK